MTMLHATQQRTLSALSTLLLAFGACQQVAMATEADSLVTCDFRFKQSSSKIDSTLANNRKVWKQLRQLGQTDYQFNQVSITAWASPDGNADYNRRLARQRAMSVKLWLMQHAPQLAEKLTSCRSGGEQWQLLREQMQPNSNNALTLAERQQVRRILEAPITENTKKWRLKHLPFFNRMVQQVYAPLRKASLNISFNCSPTTTESTGALANATITTDLSNATHTDTTSTHTEQPNNTLTLQPATNDSVDTLTQLQSKYDLSKITQRTIAFKTNLLYDALLVPNIGIEVPLGQHWSAALNWLYAWWKNDHRHRYWRIYGGDVEARYWFKNTTRQVLTRHHVGVYAQALVYDFENGQRGYMGGRPGQSLWQKATLGAGLSYGYAFNVARHLTLDLSLGVGYLGGQYQEYVPKDGCYVYDRTRRLRYLGPTKAEVSLVWHLNWTKPLRTKGGEL